MKQRGELVIRFFLRHFVPRLKKLARSSLPFSEQSQASLRSSRRQLLNSRRCSNYPSQRRTRPARILALLFLACFFSTSDPDCTLQPSTTRQKLDVSVSLTQPRKLKSIVARRRANPIRYQLNDRDSLYLRPRL